VIKIKKIDRTGETRLNNSGFQMTIIAYRNNMDIDVLFENGTISHHKGYKEFSKGGIKMPMDKTVFGHGIIDGKDLVWDNDNKKTYKSYICWSGMLERCFDEKLHKKYPTYIGCTLYNDWLYLSKFTRWFNDNYYEIPGCKYRMELDKDILSRYYFNNIKMYSPETAVFVPRDLNLLLCKNDKYRGKYPVGVTKSNKGGYVARLSVDGERKYLGYRDNPIDAFYLYKEAKEKEIKRKAELYKEYIPNKVYIALMNYKVDIND